MDIDSKKYRLSFIIPLFNESESIEELASRIKSILPKNYSDYEIIFVNDGSSDQTLEILKGLHQRDKNIKIVSFRKNLGKAAALNQGFKRVTGDIVITLDGDLQDGPENIPQMVSMLSDDVDMVVGWKKVRRDPISKIIPSKLFNFFVRIFSGVNIHDFNSGLKVMKSVVAKETYLYGEMHRFIPVLATQRGFKVSEVAVNHHARIYGKSKYGWTRAFEGFFDFLTVMFLGAFKQRPLHLFGIFGLISIFIGILLGVYLSFLHFQGVPIVRRPLLTLSVLMIIAGLQILFSGLIAEIIVDRNSIGTQEDLPIDYEV